MKMVLKKMINGRYDSVKYWNSRTNPNNAEGESPERVAFDIRYIAQSTVGEKHILELGPGVGRTFQAYDKDCTITSLDISKKYASQLKTKCDDLGLDLRQIYLDEPNAPFPFEDNSFQVGVASQVLLHIEPEPLLNSLRELVRVCEKVVVITAYTHGKPLNTGLSHVFNHDYFSIVTELGCAMHDVIMNEGRICFTIRKR